MISRAGSHQTLEKVFVSVSTNRFLQNLNLFHQKFSAIQISNAIQFHYPCVIFKIIRDVSVPNLFLHKGCILHPELDEFRIHSRDYFHQGIFAKRRFPLLSVFTTHTSVVPVRLHRHEYLPHRHHLNLLRFTNHYGSSIRGELNIFSDFFSPCSAICFSQRMVPNSSIWINQNARNSLNVCFTSPSLEVETSNVTLTGCS